MPSPATSHRFQDAVLWPATGWAPDGSRVVGDPVGLRVRWVEKQAEMLDAKGEVTAIDVQVFVDRRIPIGSLMAIGSLADWAGTADADAENDRERLRVAVYNCTPDVKGRFVQHSVGLKRGTDGLTGG